jgi:hypothetical protein
MYEVFTNEEKNTMYRFIESIFWKQKINANIRLFFFVYFVIEI